MAKQIPASCAEVDLAAVERELIRTGVLRRDVPKFQLNYTKAAFTFAMLMTSICYADMLA
jgi:hypothetical protein